MPQQITELRRAAIFEALREDAGTLPDATHCKSLGYWKRNMRK